MHALGVLDLHMNHGFLLYEDYNPIFIIISLVKIFLLIQGSISLTFIQSYLKQSYKTVFFTLSVT